MRLRSLRPSCLLSFDCGDLFLFLLWCLVVVVVVVVVVVGMLLQVFLRFGAA